MAVRDFLDSTLRYCIFFKTILAENKSKKTLSPTHSEPQICYLGRIYSNSVNYGTNGFHLHWLLFRIFRLETTFTTS